MKAVVQRVRRGRVEVGGEPIGHIEHGLLVYAGVGVGDGPRQALLLADKIAGLRVFEDDAGKMNLSVRDVGGGVLAIPNFTLMADARKGRRPAFVDVARPEQAQPLYEAFVQALIDLGCTVACGKFREHMIITAEADGPVNIVLEIPPAEG